MATVALLVGLFLGVLGILGLVDPELFVKTVAFFQVPPALYLAAVVRIAIGVVLLRVATRSRAANAARILGVLILIGGILTPLIGERSAHVILDWWATWGSPLVRMWAAVAVAVGAFIAYAVADKRADA